ncbi:TetR/AcrR family transcriptional regulator [Paraconexibacter algicola]|nr:TetR/AcrR family transcriptional regulator [Paraconexibacter algicola]
MPATRTDRRRARTRRQLVAAARELITERGVAGLRIAELTDAADVGRGSFYNHFDSKEDLVAAVFRESLETLAHTILTSIPDDLPPAERAAMADRRFVRLAYEDPDFARLLVQLHNGDDLFATATLPYARMALEPGIASGDFDVPDVDVMLVMLASSSMGLIRAILEGRVPPHAEQAHAESILRLLGVTDDEARRISRLPLD